MKTVSVSKDSPFNVSIIGGGRWARVLIETICSITDTSVKISVYSKSNAAGMAEWVYSKKNGHKIQVFEELPKKFDPGINAVIVVNAARDHEKVVFSALSAGGNVLVEKPLTLNYQSSENLLLFAKSLDKTFAAAHVFLFASYFIKYSSLISRAGKISKIDIQWEDPGSEDRYGEKKQYDPGLTVFSDWLPHVLSMLLSIVPGKEFAFLAIELEKGGASVFIDILIGDIPCRIRLTRNGQRRKRFMEVHTVNKTLQLDFSKEPGIIYDGNNEIVGDPGWQLNERPVAAMLRAFLNGVIGKEFDKRLNAEIGLKALKVIDLAMADYRSKQIAWLIEELTAKVSSGKDVSINEDLFYALSEIFQTERSIHTDELNRKIHRFLLKVSSPSANEWLTILNENETSVALAQIEDV